MSTTTLTAGQVMDRVAALLNDTPRTDYTYVAMLPYLNTAIDELAETLQEANNSPTNLTSETLIALPIGLNQITAFRPEDSSYPHYPDDLVEIQEVGERLAGTADSFTLMQRREFVDRFTANNSLLFWAWEDQKIKFNPNGAITRRDIQLKYVREGVTQATGETSVIGTINARSFLSYKTAALCAMFIGENPTRAQILDGKAEEAIERLTAIGNKGRQQMTTRRRPFRASYKSRGWL